MTVLRLTTRDHKRPTRQCPPLSWGDNPPTYQPIKLPSPEKLNTPYLRACHLLRWPTLCLWSVYLPEQTFFHFTMACSWILSHVKLRTHTWRLSQGFTWDLGVTFLSRPTFFPTTLPVCDMSVFTVWKGFKLHALGNRHDQFLTPFPVPLSSLENEEVGLKIPSF